MKARNKFAITLATLSTAILSGCGASQPGPVPVTPVAGGVVGTAGCLPITGPIPFTGTNVSIDGAFLKAGTIPNSGQYGQMITGGGATGGTFQGNGTDGTISIAATPMNTGTPYNYNYNTYPTYNNGTVTANITGFVQLSASSQQGILNDVQTGRLQLGIVSPVNYNNGYNTGYYNGYNTYNSIQASQICVSQIAIDGYFYQTVANRPFTGKVYLYLNNTQHGYTLYFY